MPTKETMARNKLRVLRNHGAHQEATVAAAFRGEAVGAGVVVIDEVLGAGREVVEDVLFVGQHARLVPVFAELAAPRMLAMAKTKP